MAEKTNRSHSQTTQQLYAVLRHCGGDLLKIKFDHMVFLDGDCCAAALLAYLLDLMVCRDSNDRERRRLRRNCMWIRLPVNSIRRRLGFDRRRCTKAVNSLVAKKLLETTRRCDNVLWVRIDTDTLKRVPPWYEASTSISSL